MLAMLPLHVSAAAFDAAAAHYGAEDAA